MIPTAQDLRAISKTREGDLRKIPFSVLLIAAAVHKRTVVLELKRKQLYKRIVMEFGVPVDCRSNLAHETLGRFMVGSGQITQEQCTEILGESVSKGVRFGEVLLEKKLITPYDLFRTLQQNLAKKLLDCFTWREGTFRTLFDVPEVESPLKVNVAQLIVMGISRFALLSEVDEVSGGLVGKILALHPDPPLSLEGIRLTGKQTRLVDALRKGRRLDELKADTGLPYQDITRLLYALSVMGIVVPADRLPERQPERPAPEPVSDGAVPEQGPRQAGLSPEALEGLRNDIMQTYLQYRQQDTFSLLDLPQDAGDAAVRQAFLTKARKVAPWQFEGTDLKALAEKAEDLLLAYARAYARLAGEEGRTAERKKVREAAEAARRTSAADAFKIQTDLLDPEAQFGKGVRMRKEGKTREALRLFEFAADCDPQNGVYLSEVAFTRYLHSPLLHQQALRELEEALRIDPRCGLAEYYIGEILREQGHVKEAEGHLRKAAKMMGRDTRPLESLKALARNKK